MSAAAPQLRVVESEHHVVVEHDHPLVPEGEYLATLVDHDVVEMHQFKVKVKDQPKPQPQPKLFMRFQLFDAGEYSGKLLFMAFRVRQRITAKRFRVGRRSKLMKMLCRLLNPRTRVDRLSLKDLTGCLLRIKVRTVKKDADGDYLHAALAYSVVDDVLKLETEPRL